MPLFPNPLEIQIKLIEDAMKKAGVWSLESPDWIASYRQEAFPEFWPWLQYIYLPLRLRETSHKPHYLAPMLIPYINAEVKYNHLLQLAIELDSISSAIPKKLKPDLNQ